MKNQKGKQEITLKNQLVGLNRSIGSIFPIWGGATRTFIQFNTPVILDTDGNQSVVVDAVKSRSAIMLIAVGAGIDAGVERLLPLLPLPVFMAICLENGRRLGVSNEGIINSMRDASGKVDWEMPELKSVQSSMRRHSREIIVSLLRERIQRIGHELDWFFGDANPHRCVWRHFIFFMYAGLLDARSLQMPDFERKVCGFNDLGF